MIGVISYHLSTVVIDSPSTSWCTPAMTIFSPGFKPSEMRVCASPVGVLTVTCRLWTLLSSTTQTYILFPSLSPNTALSGMIVQLFCTNGPTSAVKRMPQVKPGFTA